MPNRKTMREHDRLSRALARAGEQFKRAATVGLGETASVRRGAAWPLAGGNTRDHGGLNSCLTVVREGHSCDDQREATGEIIARTAVEPHSVAVVAGDDPKAIVLDLVQP